MARPDLTPAHPSGAIAGTFRPVGQASVEVLMGDGTWRYAAVIGWARDTSGQWRVLLLWYAPEGQREDWYLYDPARVRRVRDDDPPTRPLATQQAPGSWAAASLFQAASGRQGHTPGRKVATLVQRGD